MKVIALKNIWNQDTLLASKGMRGLVVGRYIQGPHKYIVVEFANKCRVVFGDETHPLISYKGFVSLNAQ